MFCRKPVAQSIGKLRKVKVQDFFVLFSFAENSSAFNLLKGWNTKIALIAKGVLTVGLVHTFAKGQFGLVTRERKV